MHVRDLLDERRAQAVVEMAIVTPVLIVLALISCNLMIFAAAVARFDRVVPDIVLAHAVSPAGMASASGEQDVTEVVAAQIEQAMAGYDVEITVERSIGVGEDDGGMLALVGALHTYRCTMSYTPWPGGLSIAGVDMGSPLALKHVRETVLDPWRPGVVM